VQGVDFASALAAGLAWQYGQDRTNLFYLDQFTQFATASGEGSAELAAKYAASLAGAGTVPGKEWVLKQLSIIGTPAQVAQLKPLLKDEKLNYMTRRALEKIPGDEATAVLRELLAGGTDLEKIGAVASLALRGDEGSVDSFVALLDHKDDRLANEAARGLAILGGAKADSALAAAWGNQHAAASPFRLEGLLDSYLAIAEAKAKAGDKAAAEKIYTQVLNDKGETLAGAAGLRGVIRLNPATAGDKLAAAFKSPSRFTRDQAARLIRELPAEADLASLYNVFASLDEPAQIQVALALGDRADAKGLPTLRAAAENGSPEVKIAALHAIGLAGGKDEVAFLAPFFTAKIETGAKGEGFEIADSTTRLQEQAAWALSRLRGQGVDAAIVSQVGSVQDPATKSAYIVGLGARDAQGITDSLIAMTQEGPANVRDAAWKALETIGTGNDLPKLLDAMSKAEGAQQEAARLAIGKVIANSGTGAEDRVPLVVERINAAPSPEAKVALIRLLGAIGTVSALEQIGNFSTDADANVSRAAVQSLSTYADVPQVPSLLAVARNTQNPAHRALAIQGVARLVPKMVQTMSLDKLFPALNEALALAPRPEEKRALLDPISKIVRPELLQPLVDQMDDPAVVEEASLAVVTLSEFLMKESPKHASPALQSAMQKVIGASKTQSTVDRANTVLLQVSAELNAAAASAAAAPVQLAALDAPANYTWDEQADSLALLNNGQIVWKFNYQADAAKPYFHPVALPNGDILTEPLPADHPWHRALWFSWKEINGINYWEENDGQATGKTVTKNVSVHKQPDFGCHLIMDLSYHEEGKPDVLTERRHIHISPPLADHSYWMNWQSSFTAQSDVELKGGNGRRRLRRSFCSYQRQIRRVADAQQRGPQRHAGRDRRRAGHGPQLARQARRLGRLQHEEDRLRPGSRHHDHGTPGQRQLPLAVAQRDEPARSLRLL
jgi:HEAT repeat protein